MKTKLLAVLLTLLVLAPAALAWGPATHVLIVKQLQNDNLQLKNQMYGAVAPDVNQVISFDQNSPFFYATHYGEMLVWDAARNGTIAQKSLAFGFVSHNEEWGADHTAHISSLTLDPSKGGYVIQKAETLCRVLGQQLEQYGMTQYSDLLQVPNCHFVLEYGIDLMIRQRNPQVAYWLKEAALHRSPEMPALLVKAYTYSPYGSDFASAFAPADEGWRQNLVYYASLLELPMDEAVPQVAGYLVALAQMQGIIPPKVDVQAAQLLIQLALADTMAICTDYPQELQATVPFVAQQMATHGVE
jgi:hypothetical protein